MWSIEVKAYIDVFSYWWYKIVLSILDEEDKWRGGEVQKGYWNER